LRPKTANQEIGVPRIDPAEIGVFSLRDRDYEYEFQYEYEDACAPSIWMIGFDLYDGAIGHSGSLPLLLLDISSYRRFD
jgi:hypothetical protein